MAKVSTVHIQIYYTETLPIQAYGTTSSEMANRKRIYGIGLSPTARVRGTLGTKGMVYVARVTAQSLHLLAIQPPHLLFARLGLVYQDPDPRVPAATLPLPHTRAQWPTRVVFGHIWCPQCLG